MNKEESFLKYLDNQLTDIEKQELEKLIKCDNDAHQLFEEVKRRKADTLKYLEDLNPELPIEIPLLENLIGISESKGRLFSFHKNKLLPYAAGIVFLLGLSISLWLLTKNKTIINENLDAEKTLNSFELDELDYYISPNRCIQKHQLVLIFEDFNPK
jgi:hypothetical protein